jgi:hypothetical protein
MYKVPIEIDRERRIARNKAILEKYGIPEAVRKLAALNPVPRVRIIHKRVPHRTAVRSSPIALRPRTVVNYSDGVQQDSDSSFSINVSMADMDGDDDNVESGEHESKSPGGRSAPGTSPADDLHSLLRKAIPSIAPEVEEELVQLLLEKHLTADKFIPGGLAKG